MAKTYNNFADIITFSRGSNATVRDSDGYIKWAGHNILDNSEDFSNWTATATTVVSNDATAPDGTETADKLTSTSTNQVLVGDYSSNVSTTWQYKHSIYLKYIDHQWIRLQADSGNGNAWFDVQNGVVGTTKTEVDSATIEDVGGGWYKCTIEVTIDSESSQSFNIAFASSDNSTFEASGGSVHVWGAHVYNCQYLDMVQNPANTWTGGGSYYKTGTSGGYFAPRIEHDPDGNVKGLLIEEERENLRGGYLVDMSVSGASETLSSTTTLSPAGKYDATYVNEDTTNAYHRFRTTTLVEDPAGTYKTAHSVYVKEDTDYAKRYLIMTSGGQAPENYAVFDLSGDGSVTETGSLMDDAYIEKAGNGWYRCTIATNGDGTSATGIIFSFSTTSTPGEYQPVYTGNGESAFWFWGYQCESIHNSAAVANHTNLATSYIPTKSNTAYTRSADDAQLNRSDLGWNNDEGTVYVEALTPQAGNAVGFSMFFHIGDGTTLSRFWVGIDATNSDIDADFKSENATVATLTTSMTTAGVDYGGDTVKAAFAYKKDDFACSVNGQTAVTDTSGSIDDLYTWDTINIGAYRLANTLPLNAPIVNIKYYPRRLTDDQLEDLTS
jgi:hypothetical protein